MSRGAATFDAPALLCQPCWTAWWYGDFDVSDNGDFLSPKEPPVAVEDREVAVDG